MLFCHWLKLSFIIKHNLVGHARDLGNLKTIILASLQSTTKLKKSMIKALNGVLY